MGAACKFAAGTRRRRAGGRASGWATRRPWAEFGPMVAQQAWQRGFFQAGRQALVGDGAANVWTLWRNHFSSFVPILDIIHAISYLFAAAMAGRPFAAGWPCYVRWI